MEITVEEAITVLPTVINLTAKLGKIISTNTAMSIDEEVKALEAVRMRPSDEVIAEADGVAGTAGK